MCGWCRAFCRMAARRCRQPRKPVFGSELTAAGAMCIFIARRASKRIEPPTSPSLFSLVDGFPMALPFGGNLDKNRSPIRAISGDEIENGGRFSQTSGGHLFAPARRTDLNGRNRDAQTGTD